MILIYDIIIGLLLGFYLNNKKYITGKLSVLITPFIFIVTKSILLGIFLGLFYKYSLENILQYSLLINYFTSFLLVLNIKYLKPIKLIKFNLVNFFALIFIAIVSIFIFNIIPYGGDELMYHLPISIELLNKQSWMADLGLSPYWHNNIRQRYPKNLYFVIDYFFVNFGKNIVGFQIYPIFAFGLFFLTILKLFKYLFNKNEIENNSLVVYSGVLVCTIPVIFLHLFIKVDILFFSIINLLIYNLFIFKNIYFLIYLGLLIIGLKILGIYLFGVICIGYLAYLIIFDKDLLKQILSTIWKKLFKILLFSALFTPIFLYSFLFNAKHNGSIIYPVNIVHFQNSGGHISIFGLKNLFRDLIFSDYGNYLALKESISSYINNGFYNYERGLGLMGFIFIIGIILYFLFYKKEQNKINYFIFTLTITFIVLSSNKLNMLFGHRYQFFIYTLLTFIVIYSIYLQIKDNIKYLIFIFIGANLILSFPYIGSFSEKYHGFKQIYKISTPNYCDKIEYMGDLARDDFKNGWKYLCKNIENKNILTINQVFNFYLYGKNFDNNITNSIFYNKTEFFDYISANKIDYIITGNKNNLYTKYGIIKNKFYTNTTDINDESTTFCKDVGYKDVIGFNIDYKISDKDNVKFNFGINNFENNLILDGNAKKLSFGNTNLSNLCLTIFDTPTKSLNNDVKSIIINKLQLFTSTGKTLNIDTKGFIFTKKAMEDNWLEKAGYKKIFLDDYNKIDYFYIWKKDTNITKN